MSTIFLFEKITLDTLQKIPMIVRFKLDLIGIKLSLRQWGKFLNEERLQLVERPVYTAEQIDIYKDHLITLIIYRADEEPAISAIEIDAEWASTHQPPHQLIDYVTNLGVQPPIAEVWSNLGYLQRFTLTKLSRSGHKNELLVAAMREFGLLGR